jgi:hypothetical protein
MCHNQERAREEVCHQGKQLDQDELSDALKNQ